MDNEVQKELENKLKNMDIVGFIDISWSMNETDGGSVSRIKRAKEAFSELCSVAEKYDDDGLTMYLFNNNYTVKKNVTASMVPDIFKENPPTGGTKLGAVLEVAVADYFERKKTGKAKQGEIFLVLTDGEPSDKDKVFKTIVETSKQIDHDQEIGICFIQAGNDSEATAFLKELDDDLVSKHGAKHDIVDTIAVDKIGDRPLQEVLINALID